MNAPTSSRARAALALSAIALLSGCAESERSFSENVGLAFEACNAAEIRFVATRHNFSPAFDWCGSNHFAQFAWSPNGERLYYELTLAHHVTAENAPDKPTMTVPTAMPVGRTGWLGSTTLAIPLGPDDERPGSRIAVYNIDQRSLFDKELPGLREPDDVTAGDGPSDVLFTAIADDDVRRVYHLDLDSGEITRAFPWMEQPVDTFTYTPDLRVAVVGHDNTVNAWDETGALAGTWTPATRGSLHPGGQWLMLEHEGDPISIFAQRTWDELSDNARRRELQRTKAFEEKLPESYPKEVRPPTLSVVRMATGERWAFDAFYGSGFQWYEAQDFYGSFVLWGFEGKQFNRNVLLGNFHDRFRSIERGEKMMGLQLMHGPVPPPGMEAAPADAPEGEQAEAPAAEPAMAGATP